MVVHYRQWFTTTSLITVTNLLEYVWKITLSSSRGHWSSL